MATETTRRLYELQVKLASESLAQLEKLRASTSKIEAGFSKLGGVVKEFGAGLAAAFSVGALVAAVTQSVQAVDELAAAAQRVGLGTEAFSALTYAASQSDMEVAELSIGLKELQKSMIEVGTKGAGVLDALGIDKTKPMIEVLTQFAEKFKTIQDPIVQTNALIEVFGKSGLAMRPLLEQGAAGIDALMAKAKELGFTISEETAKAFSDFDNLMKDSKASSEAMTRNMTEGMIPALTDLKEAFAQGAKNGETFKDIGRGIGVMLQVVGSIVSTVAFAFNVAGKNIGQMAAALTLFMSGDIKGAAKTFSDFRLDVMASIPAFVEQQKAIFGVRKEVIALGDDEEKNSKAIENNTAKVKAALQPKDKDAKKTKEQQTAYEKFTEEINNQIDAMNRQQSQNPEQLKALQSLAAGWAKMTEEERKNGLAKVAAVGAMEDAAIATKAQAEALKELNDLTGVSAMEELARQTKLLDDAFFEGKINLQEYTNGLDKINKISRETKTSQSDLEKMTEALADKIDGYAKSISDNLIDMVAGAGDAKMSFKDFANSVLRDIAKMVTQMLLIEPMMANIKKAFKSASDEATKSGSGFSGFLSALFGGSGSGGANNIAANMDAKGNVYTSPSLSQYSNGVYNSPRAFTFAKGAGVFAEAGPEAIMPLKRGPDGSLGVETSGAGVTVNVFNEARAQVETKSRSDTNGNRVIEVLVKNAVSNGIKSGAFDSLMGSTYGLNRQGAR